MQIFHFLQPFFFFFFRTRVDSSPVPDVNANLLSLFLCISGTTAKHVVFLAGNTAKHGLRCKACKMSLHHKCENRVGMQQRCMGKLVRSTTRSHTNKHTGRPVRSPSASALYLLMLLPTKTGNWHPFHTRMRLFINHSLCVSVLLNQCSRKSSSARSSSLCHHSSCPATKIETANVTLVTTPPSAETVTVYLDR